MKGRITAPLLSRVKSWQLVGLGISGWITLYSIATVTYGSSSFLVGNTQGACFAVTMTLASIEARRFKPGWQPPPDPFEWVRSLTTEQLNQTLKYFVQKQEFRVEVSHAKEIEMGFGVRAVSAGRTVVFRTERWKEAVIDLQHAQTTEENRKKILADLAIIVGTGVPHEDTVAFVKKHPLQLLIGKDLIHILKSRKPPVDPV